MLKKAFELALQLLTFLRDLKETREKVTVLQEELGEVNKTLRDLSHKFQALEERERAEREKLMLQLEIVLLRSGKLPLPPAKKRRKKS